jgi:hypothetical protein
VQTIVAIYAQRTQIEQAFRDTHNARFGLALSHGASRTPERLAVPALLASLAEVVPRLTGQCAISHRLRYDLQLNNCNTRPEISVVCVSRLLVAPALSAFTADERRRTMQAWTMPHHALRI